MRIVDENALG